MNNSIHFLKLKLSETCNSQLATYWREARQWETYKLADNTDLEKMILSLDEGSDLPLALITLAISTEISERFTNTYLS